MNRYENFETGVVLRSIFVRASVTDEILIVHKLSPSPHFKISALFL